MSWSKGTAWGLRSAPAEHWTTQAACRDAEPEIFFPFPSDHVGIEAALAFCRRCPVRVACLEGAAGDDDSIRGGLTPQERRNTRRRERSRV